MEAFLFNFFFCIFSYILNSFWGRYGFDRHYEAYFATHLADVKRQLNITAKNNNSYALAA